MGRSGRTTRSAAAPFALPEGYVALRMSNEIRQVTIGTASGFNGPLEWMSWLTTDSRLWGRLYTPCIDAETRFRGLSRPPVRGW